MQGNGHRKSAKGCPDYISMVAEMWSCSYQNTVCKFKKKIILRSWVFEFEFWPNFSFWVLSQFEFLSSVAIWVLSQFEFWVLSQFEFLRLVTIWVFEFFFAIWVFQVGLWNIWDFEFFFLQFKFLTTKNVTKLKLWQNWNCDKAWNGGKLQIVMKSQILTKLKT